MQTAELSSRRDAAETIARDAGRLAARFFAEPASLGVAFKGPQDVLTAADGAVERMIVESLRAQFPGDAFLGEEGGGTVGDRCWIIDPIDGTANFARGRGNWCVSIAFVASGRSELGVICDPNADLLYSARRGAGARRNGVPIRVSETADMTRATVDVGYSRRTSPDDFCGIVARLLDAGANLTQCGSAALGLAQVADGRLDGYAERHLFSWDVLAGLLLVEEAGGAVNEFLAGDALTQGNAAIAATPALYAAISGALAVR